MSYKVTIGIPAYNAENLIERALLSALNQTLCDIEILIVNDASSDHTVDKIAAVSQSHPRKESIRLLSNETNQGIAFVRNLLIDQARGTYLYYLDADDEMALDALEIMYNDMQQQPVDFIFASTNTVSTNGEVTPHFTNEKDTIITGEYRLLEAYLKQISRKELVQTPVWNKLYNLKFLRDNKIKCTPGYVYEDSFFTFQVIVKAKSCRLIPNLLYSYYVVDNSIAHQGERHFNRHYINSCLRMMADLKLFCGQYTETPLFEKLIIYQLLSCYYQTVFILRMKNRDKISLKDLKNAASCKPLTWKRLMKFTWKNKLKGAFFLLISICPASLFLLKGMKRPTKK